MTAQAAWVRIAIVAYNSGEHLQHCVDALAAQTCRNFEAVIVNNASPDRCTQTLVLPDNRFSVLQAGDNLGFASGSNLGLAGADTEWVATLNPDTRLASDCLARLKAAAEWFPGYAMLSPLMVQADSPDRLDGAGDVLSVYGIAWRGGQGQPVAVAGHVPREVFAPCGAAAFYRRDAFEMHGGFDSNFFCYIEDLDLGLRMVAAGAHCLLVPEARLSHVGSATLGAQHDFIWFHSYRNTLWMLVRSLPLCLLLIVLPAHATARGYLFWRTRKQVGHDARRRGWRAGWAGIWPAFCSRRGGVARRSRHVWPWLVWSPAKLRGNALHMRAPRRQE